MPKMNAKEVADAIAKYFSENRDASKEGEEGHPEDTSQVEVETCPHCGKNADEPLSKKLNRALGWHTGSEKSVF